MVGAEQSTEERRLMPASLSHQERVLAFQEATEAKAIARANVLLEVVTCLALARREISDPQLRNRISLALLNSYLAFEREVKPDLPAGVIPIALGFAPRQITADKQSFVKRACFPSPSPPSDYTNGLGLFLQRRKCT